MRLLQLAITFLCLCSFGYSNAQISKTIHHTFPVTETVENLFLDLAGKVNVETRGSARVLVEVNVSLDNGNGAILDYLISQGRYEIAAEETNGTLHIYTKKLNNDEYMRKGRELKCQEFITYTVYVPTWMKTVKYNTPSQDTTAKAN